jgi:CubicO group peptidase (beta-lactamase class C family)
LRVDVQAPGHPMLRVMRVAVDREHGVVRAGLFGFIGGGLAQARPNGGCAVLPDGKLDLAAGAAAAAVPRAAAIASRAATLSTPRVESASAALEAGPSNPSWPEGDGVQRDSSIEHLLANDVLAGPGMRAIVVVHRGRIVAERYAEGFDSQTPQLGWSMAKSVTAGLIGILVKDGRMTLDQPAGWFAGDGRSRIKISDLLAMSSGLRFNEGYGAVSDVTRMLYLEPDMAAFARGQPLEHPVGTVWSYSSGTAVMLARLFQDTAGADAVMLMRHRLFEPLGMSSAVMETDERGTLVGSSYMYATPRDWARYGQFLVQDGVWNGQDILPRGYVAMMSSPAAASGGEYGQALVWRWVSHSDTPGANPDAEFAFPADMFWMTGHDGQYIAVVPSAQLVVVRMGLTPSRERYRPQPLVKALLQAVK